MVLSRSSALTDPLPNTPCSLYSSSFFFFSSSSFFSSCFFFFLLRQLPRRAICGLLVVAAGALSTVCPDGARGLPWAWPGAGGARLATSVWGSNSSCCATTRSLACCSGVDSPAMVAHKAQFDFVYVGISPVYQCHPSIHSPPIHPSMKVHRQRAGHARMPVCIRRRQRHDGDVPRPPLARSRCHQGRRA